MGTSFRLKRTIDIHSDKTVFIGRETGEYAATQINHLKKIDISKAWQAAYASIPSVGAVKGSQEEEAKAYIAQIALGSIPVVVGSSEAFNPANWKKGTINNIFADSLYRGGISGVHTGANKAEITASSVIVGTILQFGWVQDKASGKWYYLKGNGEMAASQWRQDQSGKWYYLRSNGEMAVSQIRKGKDGNSYYLGEDGAMVTDGEITWGGKVYHADSSGKCILTEGEGDDVREKVERLMQAASEMGEWYTGNIPTYQGNSEVDEDSPRMYYPCNLIGMTVGDDCSSFVSACLVRYGLLKDTWYGSVHYNKNKKECNEKLKNKLESAGFLWHSKGEDYIPQRGDISVQHEDYDGKTIQHVEIVDSYNNNIIRVWTWGRVYKSLPDTRTIEEFMGRTSGYWRIEK